MIKTAGGSGTNYVIRDGYGIFPDNTGDWTILISFRYPSTPAAAHYANILSLFDGAGDFTDPYLFLGSEPATGNCILEIFDGSTDTTSTSVSITNNAQNWAAITNSSHVQTLIVNGVSIGTLAFNLDAVVWDKASILGDPSGAATSPVSAAYLRAWSRVLSIMELTAEAASITPTMDTGVLFTNPLQTSVDLTDHLLLDINHFVGVGVVTTDLTDPLLATTAAPPTNLTPADAIELTLDSAYFQSMLSGGSAVAAGWYFVTALTDGFWGAIAYGGESTYQPSITPYEGLANANSNTRYLSISSDLNRAIQFPVTGGNDYYFKVGRNGAVTPATNQVSIVESIALPVPAGSIMVNDDVFGYIAALDVNTGYPIHFFNIELNPTGEGGCPQNDGTIVLCKDENNHPALYDNQFNLITELTTLSPGVGIVSSNLDDTFAIGTWPTGHIVRLVDNLGVIDPTIYDTGISGNVQGLGLNVDASKFYFSTGASFNVPVLTWNILTNSAGSDLFAAVSSEATSKGPIVVLQDGKIVLPRFTNASPRHFVLKIVDSAGTLLHTYDLGAIATTQSQDSRLATDPADPTFVWGWGKENPDGGLSFFNKVKVSDGSLIVNLRDIVQYESGLYNPSADTSTPIRFGHSESCPFWINRVELFGSNTAFSGLYKLTGTNTNNQRIAHDNDWIDAGAGTQEEAAIPNPFGESYLAGDE